MDVIKTLIVDDEETARQGLRAMLMEEAGIELAGECTGGREAVAAIEAHRPDLVFLDVQMPQVDGFSVLRRVSAEPLPFVIFVTAYDRYALHAFDVHAVDYLLKPFSDERFHEALDKARKHIRNRKTAQLNSRLDALLADLEEEEPPPAQSYLQRVAVRKSKRIVFIDVDRIDWIEAADNYVRLHVGKQAHLLRATLSRLEERLPPDQFLRIHRSRIVNVERVRGVQPLGSGDCIIQLRDGTELASSRTYSEERRRLLGFSL